MSRNEHIKEIIGRTVQGVVVKEGNQPTSQVFLIFSDDKYYELYGDIHFAKGLDSGGIAAAMAYMASSHQIKFLSFDQNYKDPTIEFKEFTAKWNSEVSKYKKIIKNLQVALVFVLLVFALTILYIQRVT